MGELVHVRLEPRMREAIRSVVADEHFTSETEFIRDSIRKNLETYERIQGIKRLKGTSKPLSKAEQRLREERLATMSSSDLFRAFGFDKLPEVRFVSRDDELRARSTSKRDVERIVKVRRK